MGANFRVCLVFALVFVLYFFNGFFVSILDAWLNDAHYSHGFFVPLVSLFFILRSRSVFSVISKSSLWLFYFGLFLFVVSSVTDFLFLEGVSFIAVLLGLVLYFYGFEAFKKVLFPLCFLVFMVPFPYLENISYYFQIFTAQSASFLAGFLGVGLSNTGTLIDLGSCRMVIGAPCSGLNIIISLLAIACLFVFLLDCRFYKKVFLAAFALPVAVFANALRVFLLILIAKGYGCAAAMDFFHFFSGVFVFVAAVFFLILIAFLLNCLKFKKI